MLLIHIPILLIMDRRLYKALPTHQSVYLALFFLFLFSCSYSCPCSFYANTNLPHNHPYSPPYTLSQAKCSFGRCATLNEGFNRSRFFQMELQPMNPICLIWLKTGAPALPGMIPYIHPCIALYDFMYPTLFLVLLGLSLSISLSLSLSLSL